MRELVTATGSVRPEDPDHDGAANFLADKMADGGVQATAKHLAGLPRRLRPVHAVPQPPVQRSESQNQFWELNAFFRQTRVERVRDDGRQPGVRQGAPQSTATSTARAADAMASLARIGPNGQVDRAEIYYEQRNGKLKVAYPTCSSTARRSQEVYEERGRRPRRQRPARSGEPPRGTRRADRRVARPGALATVNREWSTATSATA